MKLMQRTICTAVVLLASVLVADAQLAGQEVTATISGLFRDADTGQYHNTTLDLVAEIHEPTGQWELVADEHYDLSVTFYDSEGERVAGVTARDAEGAYEMIHFEGKTTFVSIKPGEWVVRVIGLDPSGYCDYELGTFVIVHKVNAEPARVWSHWPIGGKIWFKNELGQVIPGNPQGITVVLLKNGEPVQGVISVVNTTQNQDGSYNYTVPSEALLPDDYVLRATFAETTHNENVTYPNDCADVLPDPPFTHNTPGAHTPVEGPDFTFTIEEEPPPEP